MKRTSATILLLAGLGGCASPDKVGSTGTAEGARPFNTAYKPAKAGDTHPNGRPVDIQQASATGMPGSGVVRADAPGTVNNMIQQASGLGAVRVNGGCADGSCGTGYGGGGYAGNGLPAMGPTTSGFRNLIGHGAGILPVPAMGVPGAVAAVGAMGPGSGMYAGMYAPGRTQIRFASPAGMKVTWRDASGSFPDSGVIAPGRYNFPQMSLYGLRLSDIPNLPGRTYYPTIEVYGATPETITYLAHNTVPLAFSDEDFAQVNAGNLVVKVIYLPDEKYQDIASVAGAEELVSTRLLPGIDPIAEANAKGTILAVVRIGNIDLQDPNIPPIDAPVGSGMMPPGISASPSAMPPTSMPPMPTRPMSSGGAMPIVPTAPRPSSPTTLPPSLSPTSPVTIPSVPPLGPKPISLPK